MTRDEVAYLVIVVGMVMVGLILVTTVCVWATEAYRWSKTMAQRAAEDDEPELPEWWGEDQPEPRATPIASAVEQAWVGWNSKPKEHVGTVQAFCSESGKEYQVHSDGSVTEILPKVGDLITDPDQIPWGGVLAEGMAHAPGCIRDHYGPGTHTCEPITMAEYAEWQEGTKDYVAGKMSDPYAKLRENAPSPHPRPKHALTEETSTDDRPDSSGPEAAPADPAAQPE